MTERTFPAGASPLNKGWLHFTGKDRWPTVAAAVFSCEFTTRRQSDSTVGHYRVVVSYTVGEEIYTGEFVDFGLQDEEYFHRGDTLQIRYDPKNPSRFYYPDLRTRTRFHLICFAIGAGLAAICYAVCCPLKTLMNHIHHVGSILKE
jgi:hypothetical protein